MQGLLNEKAGNSSTMWSTIKHISSNVKDSCIKVNIDGKDVVEPKWSPKISTIILLTVCLNYYKEAICYEGNVGVSVRNEFSFVQESNVTLESSHRE